jgi:hypothetical protein
MNELSFMQRFIRIFVSEATFAAMEAESKQWKVNCPACGHERSIWDMGGIRYKAAGNKKLGSLGIAVINPFWYTDLTENTEKERIFKGFSVKSVSSVYKNHGNSQRTKSYTAHARTAVNAGGIRCTRHKTLMALLF